MKNKKRLEEIFNKYGAHDFKWIDPRDIVVAQWVRTKCMFGCHNYGKNACCPPHVPTVPECRQLFSEYETGVIFHSAATIENSDAQHVWSKKMNQTLARIEKQVFLKGYQKTLLFPMTSCRVCKECAGAREECKAPEIARPTPEGMAIDVYSTVRKYGYPIQVLRDYSEGMNRYAFLLVE